MRNRLSAFALAVLSCAAAACGSSDSTAGADADPNAPDADPNAPDAGQPPTGTRTVTNAEVAFAGTETDLERYGLYNQSDDGEIDIVADPDGDHGQVLSFRRPKDDDWTHVMVRLLDKRTDYRDVAQIHEYEQAYHYKQKMYVPNDPQFATSFMNLNEDFHCEPCEANNLQVYSGYVEDDSICIWIAYSTEEDFDPRGLDRGSNVDPWPTISGNKTILTAAADGTTTVTGELPPTGAILVCRDDLQVSDLFGRWVNFEMLVKPSSFDSGRVMVWIDDKPYFYEGPNSYRWNQTGPDSDDPLAVNVFQWGLYGGAVNPQNGTPDAWELYATPPLLEIGDDILYAP